MPLLRIPALASRPQTYPLLRTFTSVSLLLKQLPPRRQIPDNEIIETFLKGSGPGGQKINKTSSAVQLKHIPTGIVVKCQETRSRTQNRKYARRLLQDRIEEAELGDEARTRVMGKEKAEKKKSAAKKRRRKYRKLAEDGEVGEDGLDGKDRAADAGDEGLEESSAKDAGVRGDDGRVHGAGNVG